MQTKKADIAYHLNLTESARRRPDLEEGDVIAFLTNAKTGQTEIEKLTHENSQRALMAGVISRSAYLYAHAPTYDVEKGKYRKESDLKQNSRLIYPLWTTCLSNQLGGG